MSSIVTQRQPMQPAGRLTHHDCNPRQMSQKMQFLLSIFLLVTSISFGQRVQYINGQWFNGNSFEKQVRYSVDGWLTKSSPEKIDTVVELDNGYVVPPFGESHNHNVTGENSNFRELSNQ